MSKLHSLLTLGPFSFEGLESPERVHLKSKQRFAVHRLGSGLSIADNLGEDCEVASFSGIFSGVNTADRIRSIDFLRLQGTPLTLTWGSRALSVLIHQFELDYSSDVWVPYRLSCYVVRTADPNTEIMTDITSSSAVSQVADILNLLQNTSINPTSGQTAALMALATLNYDIPLPDALEEAQQLACSIENQLAVLGDRSEDGLSVVRVLSPGRVIFAANFVAASGLQIALILARNRLLNIVVTSKDVNRQ